MTQAQIVQIELLLENHNLDNTIFLRSLYRTKQYKKVSDHLTSKQSQFQQEIKNICFANYKDFLQSIDVLFSVKKQILSLRNGLNSTNQNIQMSGAKLVAIRLERDQTQKIIKNLENCKAELESCLKLLQMANQFNANFREGDFYIALKILEKLDQTELPRKQKYEFVQYFRTVFHYRNVYTRDERNDNKESNFKQKRMVIQSQATYAKNNKKGNRKSLLTKNKQVEVKKHFKLWNKLDT